MEVKKLWVHLSRAEIIDILETALPRRFTEKYAFPYIHVLRVVPMRNPNLDKLWRHVIEAESEATRSAERFEAALKEIENDILSRIEVLPFHFYPSFLTLLGYFGSNTINGGSFRRRLSRPRLHKNGRGPSDEHVQPTIFQGRSIVSIAL